MKKTLFFTLILCLLAISRGFCNMNLSSSSVSIKNPPPIHYSHEAVDLIDIARFPLDASVNKVAFIDTLVKRLGDSLAASGFEVLQTNGIPANPIKSDGSVSYSYGNQMVKIAESTGTRMILFRQKAWEQEIFALNPAAVVGLPFRSVIFANEIFGQLFVHICLVDPHDYTMQFFGQFLGTANTQVQSKLKDFRNVLIAEVKKAFPDAYFDPQLPLARPETPDVPSIVEVARVRTGATESFKNASDLVTAIQKGNVFVNFPTAHPYAVGGEYQDYNYLNDTDTTYKGFLGFARFSAIKDGWVMQDGKRVTVSGWPIPNQSDRMLSLVSNSVLHVMGKNSGDAGQVITFETPAGKVHLMQVYHGYTHPLLMRSGVWHFGMLPLSVFVWEMSSDTVGVYVQNPVFLAQRYMSDVSDSLLASFKTAWDADKNNKVLWPSMTKEELAQNMLEHVSLCIRRALGL